MANLLPPRIKGPATECSTQIWVQGQFPGATVEVVDATSGTVVATGPPASPPEQLFSNVSALIPGRKLPPTDPGRRLVLTFLGYDGSSEEAETRSDRSRS